MNKVHSGDNNPVANNNVNRPSYDSLINEKVKKTFEDNRGIIIAVAIATLPVFFIAWPLGIVAIFEDAKDDVDRNIAETKIEFIKGLAEELEKNLNNSPEATFDTYVNGKDEYKQLFKKTETDADIKNLKLNLLFLAKIYVDEKIATKGKRDPIQSWKELYQCAIKIAQYLQDATKFQTIHNPEGKSISLQQLTVQNAQQARQQAQQTYINSARKGISSGEETGGAAKMHLPTTAEERAMASGSEESFSDDLNRAYESVMTGMELARIEANETLPLIGDIRLTDTLGGDAQRASLATMKWNDRNSTPKGYAPDLPQDEKIETAKKELGILIDLVSEIKKTHSLDPQATEELARTLTYAVTQQAGCFLAANIIRQSEGAANYQPSNVTTCITFVNKPDEKSVTMQFKVRSGLSTQDEMIAANRLGGAASESGGSITCDLEWKIKTDRLSATAQARTSAIVSAQHRDHLQLLSSNISYRKRELGEKAIKATIAEEKKFNLTLKTFQNFETINDCENSGIKMKADPALFDELNQIKKIYRESEDHFRKLKSGTEYTDIKTAIDANADKLDTLEKRIKKRLEDADKETNTEITAQVKNGSQFTLTNVVHNPSRIVVDED